MTIRQSIENVGVYCVAVIKLIGVEECFSVDCDRYITLGFDRLPMPIKSAQLVDPEQRVLEIVAARASRVRLKFFHDLLGGRTCPPDTALYAFVDSTRNFMEM